jgi:hypothetical protein
MFNPPPADLSDREPLFHVASTTEFWYRSHRGGNSPIYFGKSQTHRWDSPDRDFGVLDLGGDEYSARSLIHARQLGPDVAAARMTAGDDLDVSEHRLEEKIATDACSRTVSWRLKRSVGSPGFPIPSIFCPANSNLARFKERAALGRRKRPAIDAQH